jgi:hypothetical protein
MHQNPSALLVASADPNLSEVAVRASRHRFSIELDRSGLFVRLGRTEAYCCTEPERAWAFVREPGGFDAQAWRLHLIIGRIPD